MSKSKYKKEILEMYSSGKSAAEIAEIINAKYGTESSVHGEIQMKNGKQNEEKQTTTAKMLSENQEGIQEKENSVQKGSEKQETIQEQENAEVKKMKNETKMQVMDFTGFLETSGKLNMQEHKRLREALGKNLPEKTSSELPSRPLTRSEVADFLQVSTRTIDRMCEDGKLKYWKLGLRYIRFSLDDVLAAMQQVGIQ